MKRTTKEHELMNGQFQNKRHDKVHNPDKTVCTYNKQFQTVVYLTVVTCLNI